MTGVEAIADGVPMFKVPQERNAMITTGIMATILASMLAGIGNAYIHDILFLAKLHPNRALQSLTPEEVNHLFDAIHKGLEPSLLKGGAAYEKDLFGNKGGFSSEEILIGYREGTPCPVCATPILKIKTGSTSSYICPSCQPEP